MFCFILIAKKIKRIFHSSGTADYFNAGD